MHGFERFAVAVRLRHSRPEPDDDVYDGDAVRAGVGDCIGGAGKQFRRVRQDAHDGGLHVHD